jgi:DNA-binding SARP family transcriptional activator
VVADLARVLTPYEPHPAPRQRTLRLVTATMTGGGPAAPAAILTAPSVDPAPVPTTIHLRLIGSFQLIIDGEPVRLSLGPQRLLALLALRNGEVTRAFAARTLWPGLPRARAWANCRTAWRQLARQCGHAVRAGTELLRLEPSVAVDTRHVTSVGRRLLDPACNLGPAFLLSILDFDLYEDLLPDWSDGWLTADRARFRQLRLHCLEALARRLTAAGHYSAAVDAALAALAADSMRESAHEQLIRTHLAEGNRNEAMNHFTAYCQIMREELGLDPAPRLAGLLWGPRGQDGHTCNHHRAQSAEIYHLATNASH